MSEQTAVISKNDPDRLGKERIGSLLLEFAVPAIFGMLFNTLYNIIDTAFLQTAVGDTGAAVATLAMPVMTILMGFSMLAGQGGNALAAIQMGEGKHEEVERTLGNTVFLLIALALMVALFAIFAMPLLLAFISTPAELEEQTTIFVGIICVGFVFQSLGMGVNNFLRTAGKPNLAFATMGLGTLVCIVMNYLLVIHLGFGVAGSAWATIIGQTCSMIPTVGYFIFVKSAPFRLKLRMCVPRLRLCGKILVMGLASFLMQVGSMCVSLVFNMVIGQYCVIDCLSEDSVLAAIGIAQKATLFCFMPMIGLLQAAQPIIGFNFGAKLWSRVLQTFKLSAITAMVFGAIFTIVAFTIPGPLVSLFGIKGDSATMAATALTIYSVFYCPVGFQVMSSSYFQSSGQPVKSATLELTRQVLFLIPLYLFAPPFLMEWFGLTGCMSVVVCAPVSDVMSICVTTCFIVYEMRKIRRWRKEAEDLVPGSSSCLEKAAELAQLEQENTAQA